MNSPKEKELLATIAKLKQELAVAHRDLFKSASYFACIGEAAIETDEYGRIEKTNKYCRQTLGYSDKEMLGKRFTDVVRAVNEDGSLIDALDRPIAKIFLTGQPYSEKMYYLTKANTLIPVEMNVSPVIFKNVPIGAILVFRDLTDDYVKEKIQSEFICIASHQLRTPLSAINTYAQMLTSGFAGKLNDQQKSFMSVIESSTHRMNELIHTLLNVTRVEAGNISVNIQTVDIDDVCKEVVRSLKHLARDKHISIRYLNNISSTVKSDPILVSEVLSNLVSNAIKYTPQGGRISLNIKSNDRLIFSVKDNGYGIHVRDKDHVFSKYYRASSAAETDETGTGVGLYLARQIAERLEGDLWFSSEFGKGSTFYFSLPLVGSARKQGKFTLELPKTR